MTAPLSIVHLYPREMNLYGDAGNVQTLVKRLDWFGCDAEVVEHNIGDALPKSVDIVIGGGGQDSGQLAVHEDLQRIAAHLTDYADAGVPMLMVCGMYQLFGNTLAFATDGSQRDGIGLLDVDTHAGSRAIGNVTAESAEFGELIGFENHAGHTVLGANARPLGVVSKGVGNSAAHNTEGARQRSVIGTYLHGPVLPKNPRIADWIVDTALRRLDREPIASTSRADALTERARESSKHRPR